MIPCSKVTRINDSIFDNNDKERGGKIHGIFHGHQEFLVGVIVSWCWGLGTHVVVLTDSLLLFLCVKLTNVVNLFLALSTHMGSKGYSTSSVCLSIWRSI